MKDEYMHLIDKIHEIVSTGTPQRVAEHGYIVNVATARFVLASYVTTADRDKLAFRFKLHNTKTFREAVNDLVIIYTKKKARRVLIDNIVGNINGVE